MPHEAELHLSSDTVRFSVPLEGAWVQASISKQALRHRFGAQEHNWLSVYEQHQHEIHEAVRRRLAQGALEPVMLREPHFADRPAQPGPAPLVRP
jgi:hypothetical protein